MTRLIHFLLVFAFSVLLLRGQDVEALKKLLRSATSDTARINLLASLAELASEEEWPEFNVQAKKLAEDNLKKLNSSDSLVKFYKRYLANAFSNEAYLLSQNGKLSEALKVNEQSLEIRKEIGDKPGISNSYNNIGFIFEEQGNIPKALEFLLNGLKIREELGIKKNIAISLINIGGLYSDQGDKDKALEFYKRSLKLQEEIGDLAHAATSLNNIAGIYSDKKEMRNALLYYQRSLKIREKLGDKRQMSYTLNNIGMAYMEDKKNELKDTSLNLKGDKNSNALSYFEKALQLSEEMEDKNGIIAAISNISYYHLENKEYNKSIAIGEKAYKICKEAGYIRFLKDISFNLYRAYKAIGRGDDALKYHELFITSRDSIRNREFRKSNFKAQLKYEYQMKAAADSLLIAEERKVTEAKIQNEKTQKYALYGGIALITLFALFMVNRFNLIKKQKHIIELKEKETQMQKAKIEEKQKEIIESIQYAKRIQTSLLPTQLYMNRIFQKQRKNQ